MHQQNTSLTGFWDKKEHQTILSLTAPMILANITTPLIGLVDTAVLGRLDGTHHLAGAAVGAFIITQIYWVCGFLRMTSTGLSAQAFGAENREQSAKVAIQGLAVAVVIALIILLLNRTILDIGTSLSAPTADMSRSMDGYFSYRVLGAPAALMNLVLIGCLVGRQQSRQVMFIQIAGNLINAILDVLFVLGLDLGVRGAAAASVIAEYSIMIMSGVVLSKQIRGFNIRLSWFHLSAVKPLLLLNNNMLLRNLALQFCLAFVTFQGARFGTQVAAVNALLMNFFVLIALGLDGVAYAVEALVGEAKGAKNSATLRLSVYRGLFWSGAVALLYSVAFLTGMDPILSVLTNDEILHKEALTYLPVIALLPLVAHWCFLYDGVFIGLTRARAMRNSMIVSAMLGFIPVWLGVSGEQNLGLWFALLAFMLARGVTLGGYFTYLSRKNALLD